MDPQPQHPRRKGAQGEADFRHHEVDEIQLHQERRESDKLHHPAGEAGDDSVFGAASEGEHQSEDQGKEESRHRRSDGHVKDAEQPGNHFDTRLGYFDSRLDGNLCKA